jgi:AhpD family alkylhydroperoxidase
MRHKSRIHLVTREERPELANLIDSVKAQRGGTFLNLYAALANSPSICEGWLKLFTSIRQHCEVPADLREIAMLRVAVLNRAEYEFASHTPYALEAGVSAEQLTGLRAMAIDRTLFRAQALAVIDYTDQMTLRVQVEERCIEALRYFFDDKTLLELTVTIAGYNMVSRVLEALQIPHDPT